MGVETIRRILVAEARLRPETAEVNLRRAVRLYGSAEIGREAIQSPLPGNARKDYEAVQADLKARLGEDLYAALWAEGRTRLWILSRSVRFLGMSR